MPITNANLENWFVYHSPTNEQLPKFRAIRDAAKHFAQVVIENTQPSADQTDAVRKIREAVMTANASIACGGE
jgi:DNA polymerase III alpha subunit (gram-positive type)